VRRTDHGFSLLETVIATGLTMTVVAGAFAMLHPAEGAFATELESVDMQQRLRVGVDTLTRDLATAGAGAYAGGHTGPLLHSFASVQPAGQGITIISVPTTAAQTTLAADFLPGDLTLQAAAVPGCPAGTNLCGFTSGMTVAVYDDTGAFETLTIAAVADAAAQVTLTSRSAVTFYKSGSTVVEARVHTYYLKSDAASQTFQLMHADGSSPDVPVVDHVVGLAFEYYGEPRAPALTAAGDASYGPSPPALAVKTTAYPAGENCVFQIDEASGRQMSRLPALNASTALTPLTAAQFTDGPWCPDETRANRWDADLLRIRKVGVTIRVEAVLAELRGPAGVLFTNGGSSQAVNRWAPDQEIHFQVSPRNLNLGR